MNWLKIFQNRKKVLGQNERNLSYIREFNSTSAKVFADDKLLTKQVLNKAGIPNPKLLGVINSYEEIADFDWNKLPKSFVIKPVGGLEGGGIEIFFNRDKRGNWIKADGSRYSLQDIQGLASDIIDGKFSLHNEPDRVMFEERVKMYKGFQYYTYKGVPDIRIIVFNSIPIMSYVRLPTIESDGKANLAIGAVGVGIDIATGVTTTAIKGKKGRIDKIPGTGMSVSGLKIPFWNKILNYAVAAQRATGLGFVGVDFLIDREQGPMIVELNARPGLSIQLANNDGLRWRLRKALGIKISSVEKGVRLGKDLFGGDIEEDIERISGKSLIGIQEEVTLYSAAELARFKEDHLDEYVWLEGKNDNDLLKTASKKTVSHVVSRAKIDTGADSTSVDEVLLRKLGYGEFIDKFDEVYSRLSAANAGRDDDGKSLGDRVNDELALLYPGQNIITKSVISSHGRSLRLYMPILVRIGNYKFVTSANVYDRNEMQFKVIVGRKSLSRFLVEPSRKIS